MQTLPPSLLEAGFGFFCLVGYFCLQKKYLGSFRTSALLLQGGTSFTVRQEVSPHQTELTFPPSFIRNSTEFLLTLKLDYI